MTLTCRPRADRRWRRPLTPRQWQIVLLLRRGLSRQAVAAQLGLAPHTVAVHLSLLRQRLCLSRHSDPLAHVPWEQCPPALLPPEGLPPLPGKPASQPEAPTLSERRSSPALRLRGLRRWQVLLLLRAGLTTTEVARQLGLSRNTVYAHLEQIHARLGLGPALSRLAVLDYVPWEQCPPELLAWCQDELRRLGLPAQVAVSTGEEASDAKEEASHEDPPAARVWR
ncbi:hypothetical protein KTAU_30250 [Thermogemmatispora aurantia]|uniref:LuxR C-terminal-related transcriptional regulator n=1 Tax=Thermogemmatispora aurantia TaxID=2045279 RepID=UPI00124BD89A|nr:LuxR C-terminal-related transcriptional regulator [Thermogemmatispora aurantia]GER84389.1 hypothetical protein KTAU_30250 [Thermogemmatispora aurantia]